MPQPAGHALRHAAQNRKEEIRIDMPFMCSICEEESTHICVRCTKDACDNHLCERCHRCSDCCECEVALSENVHEPEPVRAVFHAAVPKPEPEPHLPEPDPDPDPFPEPEPEPGPVEA